MVEGKRRSSGSTSRRKPRGGKKGAAAQRTWKQRFKRVALWSLVTGVVFGLIGVTGLYIAYRSVDIPDPNAEFLTETTQVYYAGGKAELGQFAIQKRDSIDYDEMPQFVKDAVVASENRTFWTDSGLDPKGILRAAFSNAQGNAQQGASTITQQYVKILYLTQERTWSRKAKEAILSLKIKNQLSKQEILEGYLNTIYFGRGAYGIQAAAQAYFGRDAKDLRLSQSVVLAGVINNPLRFDPANGDDARARMAARYDRIIEGMLEMGTVDADLAAKALEQGLPKFPKIRQNEQYGGQRGHALTMVRKELTRLGFSEEEIDGGGLKVTTTFTKKAMDAAQQGVFEERPEGFGKNLHVAVASVEPGTGAVRGFYGGHNYLQSQLNWAVLGGQAGSTFKAFAVAAGIEEGWELKDTFDGNSPYELPDGTEIENQGNRGYGRVDLIKATQDSINTAFIDMTLATPDGPQAIIDTANAMGIPPAEPAAKPYGFPTSSGGLSPDTGVSLGPQTVSPINMANGYATIANRGVAADAYIIEKVEDADGVVRYTHKVTDRRAIREGVSDDVGFALQQVVKAGSGRSTLGLGRPAGGKTGTATNGKGEVSSAWFVGYTPQLSTAVMYVRGKGNEQLKDWLPSYFGSAYPAATWTNVMTRALEGEPIEPLPPAANVKGEAPSEGHEPTPTAKPKPTKKPKETKTSEAPTTPTPSEEPTPTETEDPTDGPTGPTDGTTGPTDETDGPPGLLGKPSNTPKPRTQARRRRTAA